MTTLHEFADRLEALAAEVRAEADRVFGVIQSLATSPTTTPTPADDAEEGAIAPLPEGATSLGPPPSVTGESVPPVDPSSPIPPDATLLDQPPSDVPPSEGSPL